MITDIPKASDFVDAGRDFLNIAWSSLTKLIEAHSNSFLLVDEANPKEQRRFETAFWKRAQRELGTACILILQAVEFLLKGRICAVSPYILLQSVAAGPGKCSGVGTSYSEFRTIDAQYLVQVHNTVCSEPLEDSFITFYKELRQRRNRIMHTVDRRLRLDAEQLIRDLLVTVFHLEGRRAWPRLRREYVTTEPGHELWSHFTFHYLAQEAERVVHFLRPQECMDYLGFSKKQRSYFCPSCHTSDFGFDNLPKLAVLRPNQRSSNTVWCFVCGSENTIERTDCPYSNCEGNVLDSGLTGACLSCGGSLHPNCIAEYQEYLAKQNRGG